ncbi:hypothetical protein BV898_05501 [Hypsibius exemplaris]|uniref:Uncharacterized protein n=1 Tax=Hypsibius exemplaris TaxID=2072580 RepID=A0A1W0WZ19_HYPEX|nr:hypothetical protein BV898_05501 [Hypsibius exemplaris]
MVDRAATALRPLSPLPPLTSPLEGANWATLMGLFLLDQMEIEFGDFDLLEFMRKACQDYMEGAIGRSSADLEYRVKTRKDLWMEIVAYPGIVGSSYNPDRYVRFLESLQKRLSAAEFSVVTTLDGGSTTPEILVQEKAGSQLGEAVKRIKERKTTTNDPPV